MDFKNFIKIFCLFLFFSSCFDSQKINYQSESIPINMKYLSFDLELYLDTLYMHHSVIYESFNNVYIVFSNRQNPTIMDNNEYCIRIEAPVSQGVLYNEINNFDTSQRSFEKVNFYPTENYTYIEKIKYFQSGIRINQSLSINKFNLKSLENECIPKLKLKNIVFDDKYKDWLKPDPWIKEPWFSIEGIDQNTILE